MAENEVEKDIDNNKEILVEEVELHDWYGILPNKVKKYTVTIGDFIKLMGEDSKVLKKEENEIIIQDMAWISNDNRNESKKELLNVMDWEQIMVERNFKWNTWYSVEYEGEPWVSIFIRFTQK